MTMNEIVIAFDVDGTILNNEGIPPETPAKKVTLNRDADGKIVGAETREEMTLEEARKRYPDEFKKWEEKNPTPTPSSMETEPIITEKMLKEVALEANLDQLALVLFHECRHQPESGKGIAKIREAIVKTVNAREKLLAEAVLSVVPEKQEDRRELRMYENEQWNHAHEALYDFFRQRGLIE